MSFINLAFKTIDLIGSAATKYFVHSALEEMAKRIHKAAQTHLVFATHC